MKKNALLLACLILTKFCYSQKLNEYTIDKKIEIDYIKLEIRSSATYVKNSDNNKVSISLTRQNDSISYLWESYTIEDTVGDFKRSKKQLFLKNSTIIPTSKFDAIAAKLSTINVEYINNANAAGIMDGNHYNLTFSGHGYQVTLKGHSPELNTDARGLQDYLKLCNYIWNFIEDKKK